MRLEQFNAAREVYLARIVAKSTYRSPQAIREQRSEPDVIRHRVEVIEVFRGSVDDERVLTSPYWGRAPFTTDCWGTGTIGQTWMIMKGSEPCSNSFLVEPPHIDAVTERFREYATNVPELRIGPGAEERQAARHLMHIGHYPEAIEVLKERVVDAPGDAKASLMLGQAYREWGDSSAAEAVLKSLTQRVPPVAHGESGYSLESIEALIELALTRAQVGNLDSAILLLRQAADLHPRHTRSTKELVRVLSRAELDHEIDGAVEHMFNAICEQDAYERQGCDADAQTSHSHNHKRWQAQCLDLLARLRPDSPRYRPEEALKAGLGAVTAAAVADRVRAIREEMLARKCRDDCQFNRD